jgi:hypothetical protein
MNKKLFLHSQTSNHWINSNFQSYFPSVYFKIFFKSIFTIIQQIQTVLINIYSVQTKNYNQIKRAC